MKTSSQQRALLKWKASPKGKYAAQKANASQRGIVWKLTSQDWLDFWGTDLPRRGKHPGDVVMARHGDVGPYALGNVYKADAADNLADARMKRSIVN